MFISHFFDVGIEWRVLSSLYAPQKERLAQHRWSLVGEGVQVVCGSLCQEGSWEREWLIVLDSWF